MSGFFPFDYTLSGGFRTFGPNYPFPYTLAGDFAISAPAPTIFVWNPDVERVASAQRAWTENGWFPPVL